MKIIFEDKNNSVCLFLDLESLGLKMLLFVT